PAAGAHVPRDRGAGADRPRLHRADDRGGSPVTHVTPDDRALVDRFLDMMAAEAGASRHTLAAYRNDLERAVEVVHPLGAASADDMARLGSEWSALSAASVARRAAATTPVVGVRA